MNDTPKIDFSLPASPECVSRYMSPEYQKAMEELVRKHHLAVDELTETQLAELIRQMITSGDIQRLVRIDSQAQQLVYIPYKESESLKDRIRKLEDGLWNILDLCQITGMSFEEQSFKTVEIARELLKKLP